MNFGSSLQLFALELDILQGIVNFLHDALPSFRTIEDPDGAYRLELDPPQVETRDDGDFRMGIHLTGQLFLGDEPNAFLFDTWVRLRPEVGENESGVKVGVLVFDSVEEVIPPLAGTAVSDAFGPDGPLGSALSSLALEIFSDLTTSVHNQLFPAGTPFDINAFSLAFYLGRPASMDRPTYGIIREGDHYVPDLQFDFSELTKPALVASVALAGEEAIPPEAFSIIRPGTGLGLVTTARLFELRFARESASLPGTVMQGLTIDHFNAVATDYGFDIDGAGHKTGADVSFSGSLIAQFRGGVGGQFVMRSTIETDVDSAWWVDLLSVVAAIIPGIGWILGDIFIWDPIREAPAQVENALLGRFLDPIAQAAQKLADNFSIDIIPTQAFLADVWFFDGNMGVAATAFAGRQTAGISSVSRDVAFLAKNPSTTGRHTNRRRQVESVFEITLSTGYRLKPWQAGQLVEDRLLTIPGHHAVESPLVKGGVYLRSNPDENTSNNLLD
ncbi:MAG TPA: hypothetical protein VLA46_06000 [Saprospiraceae bacterium]|nr:hypothetical protein [Saprospiraceae bacterium]